MRAKFDVTNASLINHPDFNGPAPYPTLGIDEGWENYIPLQELATWVVHEKILPIIIVIGYLVSLIAGQWWMSSRKPYDLRWLLILWNLGHSLFSFAAVYKFLPYTLYMLYQHGITAYLCDIPPFQRRNFVAWLGAIFVSRLAEFGDTAFLVLRKRKVIHLHWIHHTLVVLVIFWFTGMLPVFMICGATINLSIHAVMYGYYAARAAGIRVPGWIPKMITRAQILQMFTGLFVASWTYYVMEWTDRPCCNHPLAVYGALFTCGTFAILFINFFIHNYIKKSKAKVIRSDSMKNLVF